MNAIIGTKLSIVSPRPQTTREAILGILNEPQSQMIFVDTPGWLNPNEPYQARMKKAVVRSIYDDADVIAWVLEPHTLTEEDRAFGEKLLRANKTLCVVINKSDLVSNEFSPEHPKLKPIVQEIHQLLGEKVSVFCLSSKTGGGLPALKEHLLQALPLSPPYFPIDQLTDKWERFYVTELIREQIFYRFKEEIPHATAVLLEEFREQKGRKDLIKVSLIVETEGQMRIIVGNKGMALRDLGQAARKEIEARLGRPVFLELHVKVRKNWRKDESFLESIQDANR
jgi:GTP-binding protein Era